MTTFVEDRLLEELRELRRAERAPDDVRARVLEHLERDLELERPSRRAGVWRSAALALSGLLRAETSPLFARAAGAAVMIGVVVVALADVRRRASAPDAAHDVAADDVAAHDVAAHDVAADDVAADDVAAHDVAAHDVVALGPAGGSLRAGAGGHPASDATGREPDVADAKRGVAGGRQGVGRRSSPVAARGAPAGGHLEALHSAPQFRDASSYPKSARLLALGDAPVDTQARAHNLITNGDFSRGDRLWSVRKLRAFGDLSVLANFAVRDGALCTRLGPNEQAIGGWPWDDRRLSPNSFELARGKRYRLSLRAWSPSVDDPPGDVMGADDSRARASRAGRADLVVKVGHQRPPYAPALVTVVPVGDRAGRVDVEFVSEVDDALAGFAFVAIGLPGKRAELCIDDVSLTPLSGSVPGAQAQAVLPEGLSPQVVLPEGLSPQVVLPEGLSPQVLQSQAELRPKVPQPTLVPPAP